MNSKHTVLIIEDDPLNIKMISAYLFQNEYSVLQAADGESGIETAKREKPDLILLDVLMPRLNGFETCKILKETAETEKIPIIFLTALAESSSIKKAFEVGAVDYVSKPIEFTALLARINTHISLSKMNENLEIEVQTKTSELMTANETLQELVEDRELLIKELYHRTKNNMLVISSMLSLHSAYAENSDLSKILLEIGNNVESMALIHQKLYQSSTLTNVDMHEYVKDLVDLIQASYTSNYGRIECKLDLEKIHVSIDAAVSSGIIINELLSNSFKYAFPENSNGLIIVQLKILGNNKILLKISDNGIGIPDTMDVKNSGSLGIRTVIGIAENQLEGDIVFKSEEGFSCEIIFPDNI